MLRSTSMSTMGTTLLVMRATSMKMGIIICNIAVLFSMTRLDDIINTAGHRLSTAQMEEIIMTLPNVSEAIVIGVQDEIKGEIPVGFITV